LFTVILIVQEVYAMAVFPFPQLAELREKYTYNITPFPTSVKSSGRFVLYLEMITDTHFTIDVNQ